MRLTADPRLYEWADQVIELQRRALGIEAEMMRARFSGHHEAARDLRAKLNAAVAAVEAAKGAALSRECAGLAVSPSGAQSGRTAWRKLRC